MDYVNGLAGVVKSENIKFEAPLNGYDIYRPNKPPELPDYYEFKGWFKDPTGEKSFDFNGIMPSNNVSVYAVWKPKNIKVRFETLSLENPRYEINLEAGNKVPEQKEPIKTGYTFAGWTNASGIPYNFNTILEDDTVLYANWVSNGEGIPLIYHANGGVGTDYLDSVIDERGNKIINYFEPGNSSAKLDYIPQSWHGPTEDGKIKGFVGWTLNEDGSGKIYYPGDEFPIPDDAPKTGINLYAKWAPIRETKLAYDFNYPGSPGRHVVDIETPNEKTPINIENPVRSGYLFKGWTVKQDGSGRLLKKGDLVQVDTLKPETNVLYANWIRIIKVKVKKLVKGNQGNLNKDYEFKYQYLDSNGQTIVNTIKLKNNQDIEIGYIPEGSTFSIVESDYLSDGYTTYVSDDKTSDVKTNVWSYQVNKNSPDIVNVTFTNSKDVSPPTGIILDNLPLIIMVGIGGSWLLFYFISKIRNKSDE